MARIILKRALKWLLDFRAPAWTRSSSKTNGRLNKGRKFSWWKRKKGFQPPPSFGSMKKKLICQNFYFSKWRWFNGWRVWAVAVAKLVERLLPTQEILGSNPNIHKVISTNCKFNRKDENKEKEAGNGPSFKKPLACLAHVREVVGSFPSLN